MSERLTLKSKSKRVERVISNAGKPAKPNGDGRPEPPTKPEPKSQQKKTLREKAYPAQTGLLDAYPKAFDPGHVRPLKLGVAKELMKIRPETVSVRSLRAALQIWCSSRPYLRALAAGGDRYGLDGLPVGSVSEKDIEHAKKKLEKA